MLIFYRIALYGFKTIEWKLQEKIHFTVTICYTITSKIPKIQKESIVNKSTRRNAHIL